MDAGVSDSRTALEQTLSACIARQRHLAAIEAEQNTLLPEGDRNLGVIIEIVDAIRKIDLAEACPELREAEAKRIIAEALKIL
jgi:hypothetical protein